jgi:type I restriction enzyme S subunit
MNELKNIPEGWVETTLGEVADIGSSKRIFFSDYVSEGIPFYRSKEIIEKQKGNNISLDLFITEEKFNEIDSQFGSPKENDILLTSVGTIGIPYIVKENEKFYFKDGNLTWFKNYKKIYPVFLYHWLLSSIGIESLKKITIGSTQSALTISGLRTIPILLPSIEEQKSIAAILTAFDDKIQLLQAQNKTLEATAQTIFAEWFGKYSVDDELPEGWSVGKLGEVLEIKYGKDHKHLKDGEFPLYGSGGIMRYVEKPLYEKESILIPRKGTLSNLFYLNQPFWSVDTMFYSYIIKSFYGRFTFLFLKSLDLSAMNVGSAVPSLTTQVLNQIPIVIPQDDIVIRFDKIVSSFYDKIDKNNTQIQTLTKTRDELLPRLMSGEIRLKM